MSYENGWGRGIDDAAQGEPLNLHRAFHDPGYADGYAYADPGYYDYPDPPEPEYPESEYPESEYPEPDPDNIVLSFFGSWRRFFLCMAGAAAGLAVAWWILTLVISMVEKA